MYCRDPKLRPSVQELLESDPLLRERCLKLLPKPLFVKEFRVNNRKKNRSSWLQISEQAVDNQGQSMSPEELKVLCVKRATMVSSAFDMLR